MFEEKKPITHFQMCDLKEIIKFLCKANANISQKNNVIVVDNTKTLNC